MTGGCIRLCLVAVVAVGATGFSCEPPRGGTALRVALRSNIPPPTGVDLLAGDTIAVVRLDPADPATLASVPAGHLLAPFRAALNGAARPATSPVVTVTLPNMPPSGLTDVPLDIVWFSDASGDAAWQANEPYAAAWTGGRGGYRLILEGPPTPDRPRWRLLEGGEPPTARPDTAGIVVYIEPVRPAIER